MPITITVRNLFKRQPQSGLLDVLFLYIFKNDKGTPHEKSGRENVCLQL
jgi:hypothetical protein